MAAASPPASLRPTLEQLTVQLEQISASWEQFAIHLGFNFDKICVIRRDEQGVANQLSKMLSQWLENEPTGTWKHIVKALRSVRWNDLADKTEAKYVNNVEVGRLRVENVI